MPLKRSLRKIVDEHAPVRCVSGPGMIRVEVWEDETGNVIRYNLAFINHFLYPRDNGRVLGYDNAHGEHHRHYFGTVEAVAVASYAEATRLFRDEVKELRKRRP